MGKLLREDVQKPEVLPSFPLCTEVGPRLRDLPFDSLWPWRASSHNLGPSYKIALYHLDGMMATFYRNKTLVMVAVGWEIA